jgi:hypothetical protein
VRPIEIVLAREAAKLQDPWQREAQVLSSKHRDKLSMWVERLLDNNEVGYFYLHEDVELGIERSSCSFLRLSVALKAGHYEMCLEAKTAQLKEPFQAKLGYLLGSLYNRVGTAEWNSEYPGNTASAHAAKLLKQSFIVFQDAQIDEGLAELRRDGRDTRMSPLEIKEHIDQTQVRPRGKKFQSAALEILCTKERPLDMIGTQVLNALRDDAALNASLADALGNLGIKPDEVTRTRELLNREFLSRLRVHLSDDGLPSKRAVFEKLLRNLLQEPTITAIMK